MTDSSGYDLHSKFDIEKHKNKYVHYLEVIITQDGDVHYAVPSHQEFLIKLACDQLNITRNQLQAICPKEYYFDFTYWLTMITHSVAVWENFTIGDLNEFQMLKLHELKENSLYLGLIKEEQYVE